MKQLEKKDLVENQIYKHKKGPIFMWDHIDSKYYLGYNGNGVFKINVFGTNGAFDGKGVVEATPEQKHWLEACIAADKFVSYDEAMKTFIPKYYEYINQNDSSWKFGKIYKLNKDKTINFESGVKSIYDNYYLNTDYFKPSTKEAYNAQFAVKEPEFVLPEKWTLLVNKENHKIITDYINKIKPTWNWNYKNTLRLNLIKNQCNILYGPFVGTNLDKNIYGTEITFKQFKKYVLKEQLEEPKDKVLDFKLLKNIDTYITKVESSEGAIFELGDKITVFTKDSKNKGKLFTITDFRWSKDKSQICALTSTHWEYGIGLDKIELYSEPVKIVEDFKLPETWKLKVCDKSLNTLILWRTFLNPKYINNFDDIKHFSHITEEGYGIGYKSNLPNTTRPEITFEQFKQYVLHNGFKIGDRFNKQKDLFNNKIIEVDEKEIIDLQYINNESVAFYKHVNNNYTGPQCRILTKNIVK